MDPRRRNRTLLARSSGALFPGTPAAADALLPDRPGARRRGRDRRLHPLASGEAVSGFCPLGRTAASAGLMTFLVFLGGCTNQNATLGVSVIPPEQAEVKLSTDVMPIFGPLRGGCTGCHGDSTSSANLNLVKIFDP